MIALSYIINYNINNNIYIEKIIKKYSSIYFNFYQMSSSPILYNYLKSAKKLIWHRAI